MVAPNGIRKAVGYGYEELGSQAHLSTYALVTVLAVAAVFVVSRLKEPTPLFVAAGALLAYLFGSVYTAPWFAAWVLPLLALRWRWRVGVYAVGFFAIVMIDDRFGNAVFPQVFLRQHTFQVLLANWVNTHSDRFGAQMPTRSPGCKPDASRPAATSSARCSNSRHVHRTPW